MARLNSRSISRRTVEALQAGEREAVYWDSELQGFGIRVYPSGSKVYLVQTRKGGRSRRLTLGRHGLIPVDQARTEAARIIADIKAGGEPLPANGAAPADAGPTVAEVAERYMREHVAARCKPTTVRQCRHTLDHHLLPALGAEPPRGDRARAGRCPALQPARDAGNGEQGGRHALAPLLHGRGPGDRRRGRQPLQVRAQVQGTRLRANPLQAVHASAPATLPANAPRCLRR